jgi:hypothetical protein
MNDELEPLAIEPPKRGRGRPKGSGKNVPRQPRALAIARQALKDAERDRETTEARAKHLMDELNAVRAVIDKTAVEKIVERTLKPIEDLQLIGPSELGKALGRSTMMIKVDASRRPLTLPPRFVIPGQRKLMWRVVDVREWMDALADLEKDRRAAQVKFARDQGIRTEAVTKFNLGLRALGEEATRRMYERRQAAERALQDSLDQKGSK